MTKKQNTLVFVIVGTLCNIILSLLCIIALFILASFILKITGIPLNDNALILVMPITFVGGIIAAMIIYQKVTMLIIKKFALEDKLEPLFVRKYRKK